MNPLDAINYELKAARRRLEDYRVPVNVAVTPSPRDALAFTRAAIEVDVLERLLRTVGDE